MGYEQISMKGKKIQVLPVPNVSCPEIEHCLTEALEALTKVRIVRGSLLNLERESYLPGLWITSFRYHLTDRLLQRQVLKRQL